MFSVLWRNVCRRAHHEHQRTTVEEPWAPPILHIIHASHVSNASSILYTAHSLNSSILPNPQRAPPLKELRLPLLTALMLAMHDSASWQRRLWMTDDSGGGSSLVCVCMWGGDYEDKVSMGHLSNTCRQPQCMQTYIHIHKHTCMHTCTRTNTRAHTCTFLPGIIPSIWHSNYSTHWFQWWMNSQTGMSSLSFLPLSPLFLSLVFPSLCLTTTSSHVTHRAWISLMLL